MCAKRLEAFRLSFIIFAIVLALPIRLRADTTLSFSGPSQTDDTELNADSANSNYGSEDSIAIDGQNDHAHAVVKFSGVFGSDPGQVPLGATISSAYLKIYVTDKSNNAMQLYRLIEDWTESQATWNDRSTGQAWFDDGADGTGSHAASPMFSVSCPVKNQWYNINVTAFVQSWSDGSPNYGIVLKDGGADGIAFNSSEADSNQPVLEITYFYDDSPSVTLVSPADQSTLTTSDVSFTVSCNDDDGLTSATLYVGELLADSATATFTGPGEADDATLNSSAPGSVARCSIISAGCGSHMTTTAPFASG